MLHGPPGGTHRSTRHPPAVPLLDGRPARSPARSSSRCHSPFWIRSGSAEEARLRPVRDHPAPIREGHRRVRSPHCVPPRYFPRATVGCRCRRGWSAAISPPQRRPFASRGVTAHSGRVGPSTTNVQLARLTAADRPPKRRRRSRPQSSSRCNSAATPAGQLARQRLRHRHGRPVDRR